MTTIDFSKGEKTPGKVRFKKSQMFILPGRGDITFSSADILNAIFTKGSPFVEVEVSPGGYYGVLRETVKKVSESDEFEK